MMAKGEISMKRLRLHRRFLTAGASAGLLALSGNFGHGADSKPEPQASTAKLPLSEVILYSSGVGYFERAGEVNGHAEVDLRFKVDDINDLLKSMVVRDFNGGRVSTVTYGSRDPITKTLKTFGLDLTENPSMGTLLNQARGERVEVLWPSKAVGKILGVEHRKVPLGDNKEIDAEYLNLLTEEGLQSIPLAQTQKIRLLNEALNAELRQALEVLATGHDTQKKTVGITFDGEGKRKVGVSYIAQTPVWKTSYRLVLDDKAKPFLQGWAIVENTSDEDWENVRLSLVSGRPISFVMDLYQPLYTTRPVVEPELYLSLRPQVYGEAIEDKARRAGVAGGGGMGGGAVMRENLARRKAAAPAMAPQLMMRNGDVALSEKSAESSAMTVTASPDRSLSEELQEGVTEAAQGGQAGELFQYEIKAPVTLARQKSAMLPIINQNVAGEKVSIYNARVQAKHPLNGFRLKNSTPSHLMQGPLTVFESNTYAGDARIEDLAPGQERLLSYGLDLKMEVEPQHGPGQNDLVTVKIQKGTLIATRKAIQEQIYNVRNRDQKNRTVLIEHPFQGGWKLIEPGESPERTRDVYRFPVSVEPDKTSKLVVREERQMEEYVQLANIAPDTIAYYVRAQKVSTKVKDALQKAAGLRNKLNETSAERVRREQRTAEITQEQGRIRENMAKLSQNSEMYVRYVKKLDQQETDMENLRQEIEQFKETAARQQLELNDYLMNLNIE
jgi:hypothetical protein